MQEPEVPPAGPYQTYADRLEARRAAFTLRERRHHILGILRVIVFLCAAAMAVAAFISHVLSGWWLLAPIAILGWLGARLQTTENERTSLSRAVGFYERCVARLDGRWAGTGETGDRFLEKEHLYAKDLDIFGRGSLFQLLCSARTAMGQEKLAAWLLEPATPEIVRARQEAVTELAPRLDLREDIAVLGEKAARGVRTEALLAWGEAPPLLAPSPFRILAWGLSILGPVTMIGLFAYLFIQFGVVRLPEKEVAGLEIYLLALGLTYASIFWRFRKRTNRIIQEIGQAAENLSLIAGVLRRLEAERFTSQRLKSLREDLNSAGWPPSRRIAKLNRLIELVDSRQNMFVAVFGPLLLWDLHLSYAIENWRRVSGSALRRWLNALGEMEAISSLAGYYYDHPADVFPEFVPEEPQFTGQGLAHPLLPEDRVVRNDLSLGRDLRLLVVSGSNMSGKSTLLRAVGINTVLAQAGGPVRARSLRLSSLTVGASVRIEDSLQENTSLFYAEIIRLRQLMENSGGVPPLLFLIDELLHGTNSHDRRIGAEAVLRGLVDRGAVGLVTTHDLALAHVVDQLGSRGANVHFEDDLKDGHIHFDYRLRQGVVRKSNAIELMRSVGLEV